MVFCLVIFIFFFSSESLNLHLHVTNLAEFIYLFSISTCGEFQRCVATFRNFLPQ